MAGDVSSTHTGTLPAVAPVGGAVSPIAAETLASARGYAREALRAYAADWQQFSAWCTMAGTASVSCSLSWLSGCGLLRDSARSTGRAARRMHLT